MLENKIYKQIKIAWAQVALGIVSMISYIIMMVTLARTTTYYSSGYSSSYSSISGLTIFFIVVVAISSLSIFILWIIGIINAVNISTLTNGETTVLTIFSIFTFVIGILIAAYSVKNKYIGGTLTEKSGGTSSSRNNSFNNPKRDLDNALKAGVISGAEYDKKLKALKQKENGN